MLIINYESDEDCRVNKSAKSQEQKLSHRPHREEMNEELLSLFQASHYYLLRLKIGKLMKKGDNI